MKHQCSRCDEFHGEGELLDEQFLCNGCLSSILADIAIDAERDRIRWQEEQDASRAHKENS